MDLQGRITLRDGRKIKYCEPAGNHPRMTELLLLRADETALDRAKTGGPGDRRARHTTSR